MSYQPTATHSGERLCVDRWAAIRPVLDQLPDGVSLLDFGANAGWFSTRAAQECGARVTAVDDRTELLTAAGVGVSVWHQRMTAADLRRLPRHDVVLALSVLHHLSDWRQALAELRACRHTLIVEVPHPDERWMRSAAARHQLREIHETVTGMASARLGSFPRTGRDGSSHNRPMFTIPGTLQTLTGTVFSGSGTCGRKLTRTLHARGLDRELGYQPFPGSLNLRLDVEPDLGRPAVDWPGIVNRKRRPYQFWPAWLGGQPVHAMDPAGRGHGPDCIEVVAPFVLRERLGLTDGDNVTLEVACG